MSRPPPWTDVPTCPLDGTRWWFTVKSLDQDVRRRAMLIRRQSGCIGRVEPRPVARGLLVDAVLPTRGKENIDVGAAVSLHEPRHIVPRPGGGWLLTECAALWHLDDAGAPVRALRHPWFAFLHTVDVSSCGRYALIASAGFDQILTVDLAAWKVIGRWSAWANGFNPTREGTWLIAEGDASTASTGSTQHVVRPEDYGEAGLLTETRTAHIPAVVYDGTGILFLSAVQGALYRLALAGAPPQPVGRARVVLSNLGALPHGLKRTAQGSWVVAKTRAGAWVDVRVRGEEPSVLPTCSIADVPGKHPDAEGAEWLQQVIPTATHWLLLLDANRGVMAANPRTRELRRYGVPPEWCIQDAVPRDAGIKRAA